MLRLPRRGFGTPEGAVNMASWNAGDCGPQWLDKACARVPGKTISQWLPAHRHVVYIGVLAVAALSIAVGGRIAQHGKAPRSDVPSLVVVRKGSGPSKSSTVAPKPVVPQISSVAAVAPAIEPRDGEDAGNRTFRTSKRPVSWNPNDTKSVTAPRQVAAVGTSVVDTPSSSSSSRLVDLNSAGRGLLDTLPGIGPALAERILQYRREHGPFVTVDEITQVSGIGPKRLEKMRPYVTAGASHGAGE